MPGRIDPSRPVNTAPLGENRLVRAFRRRQEETELLRTVARIVVETGAEAPRPNPRALAGDPRRLRGIPAVGGRGSFGGHIAGTRPDRRTLD